MPNSPRSSNGSAPCRLEWRPSRWPVLALLVLAPSAAACALLSGVPPLAGAVLAVAALAWGGWQARAYRRLPVRQLVLEATGGAVLDGTRMSEWRLAWHGPLAVMRLRDGPGDCMHLAWWPDTLPAPARRELRLAARRVHAAQRTLPVAT